MSATPSTSRRARKIIRRSSLTVTAAQAKRMRFLASLLRIRPRDFLDWILSNHLMDLEDPHSGLLAGCAMRGIAYSSPDEAARAQAEVAQWVEQKCQALKATRARKGGAR